MINERALGSLFSEGFPSQIDRSGDNTISLDENTSSSEKNSISLEAGFEQLESIVKDLEQKELPLEEALNYFKLGVSLVQHCTALLNQAEKQMQLLLEDSEGQLQLEPFSIETKG